MKILGRVLLIMAVAVLVSWLTTVYAQSSNAGSGFGGRPGFEISDGGPRGGQGSTEENPRQFPSRPDVGRGAGGLFGATQLLQPTLIITAIVVFVAPVAQFFRRHQYKRRAPPQSVQSGTLPPVRKEAHL